MSTSGLDFWSTDFSAALQCLIQCLIQCLTSSCNIFFRICAWLIIPSTQLIWHALSAITDCISSWWYVLIMVENLSSWFLCPKKNLGCQSWWKNRQVKSQHVPYLLWGLCIKPCWCPYHIVPHIFIVNVRVSDRLACILIISAGAV